MDTFGTPPVDRRSRKGRKILAATLTGLASASTLFVATAVPASASTVNGIATIASPGTTTELASGGSTSQFTVALPSGAACDGDTATGGYRVYSYLLPLATALSSVTFVRHPSTGLGLFSPTGTYFGPVNTAIGTGEVPSLPNNFEWGPIIADNYVPLTGTGGLLYSGSGSSASGIWNAGIVCANTSGVPVDNWNTEVTFLASSSDANKFTWTAVPGSGTAPAFTSANSTTFTNGSSNSFTPAATGSPAPTITETGALPAGVTFSGGVLSGIPTTAGTSNITFTASNGVGVPVTQAFTLTVSAGAFTITTASLPPATLGAAYSARLAVSGGTAPFKWKEKPKLPKGLKFNKSTGAITGKVSTAAATGSFPIKFTVTDKAKPVDTATKTLTLTVNS
jgi:hypothetical protein